MKKLLSPSATLPTFLLLCLLAIVLSLLGPRERSLGAAVRLVYLHGAWVWTALLGFGAAALAGVAGLLMDVAQMGLLSLWPITLGSVRNDPAYVRDVQTRLSQATRTVSACTDTWHRWSRALGRAALVFWLAYIPLSMLAARANWNGLFLAEPRWRVAFEFAAIGLMLQLAATLLERPAWASVINIGYVIALLTSLNRAGRVMHPASPIRDSGSLLIQSFFTLLVSVCLLAGLQLARWWRAHDSAPTPETGA